MLKDLNPTTRSYPRRMEDAFPNDVENAQWFYPPERKRSLTNAALTIAGIVMWAVVIALLLKA